MVAVSFAVLGGFMTRIHKLCLPLQNTTFPKNKVIVCFWQLWQQPFPETVKPKGSLMTQAFTCCWLLVLLTKALRPPSLSERWLVHKAGLRLRIIHSSSSSFCCCWCNYTAGCEHKGAKIPWASCNYTLWTCLKVEEKIQTDAIPSYN